MSAIEVVFQMIGTLTVYGLIGTGLSYMCSKFDDALKHDGGMIAIAIIFWPVMIPIVLAVNFFMQTVPWLKRKWKAFRAPKVAKKEEAKIEKIRMCPALKLKKYEAILNKLSDSRERRYCDQMHEYLKEFERIRDGKPEWKPNPALDARPDGVYIVPHNQLAYNNFAAQAAGVVRAADARAQVWEGAMPMAPVPEVGPEPEPDVVYYKYR